MVGGSMYEAERCPKCGETMWNGRCENRDCDNHWHPVTETEDEEDD